MDRYRQLVEGSPVPMVVYVDRTVRFANPAAVALCGAASADDLLGRSVELIVPAGARDRLEDRQARRAAGEAVRGERVRIRRLDGEDRMVESDAVPVTWDGEPAVLACFADVTARVAAEERERRVAQQLDAIVSHSRALIFVRDAEGRYARVNQPWLDATGLSEDAVLGRTQAELFAGEYDERWEARARASMDQIIHTEDEFGGRWFDSVRFPLRDADGSVYAVCGMAVEITPYKEALANLARSNHDLERFAYVASHDLGEPLRTVSNFATLLSRRYEGALDEQADMFLRFMTSGVQRMRAMLEGLLAYSRADRDRSEEDVDLAGVAAEMTRDLDAAVRAAGARVEVGPLPVVRGNRVQLCQILQNLVANALKFADPERPPHVVVAAERERDAWRVTVADNGIGIEPRFAERVFEIFQRLHPRDAYDGTGVGLAIVRRLVEARGGRVGVTPGPEHGSVFAFTVPD